MLAGTIGSRPVGPRPTPGPAPTSSISCGSSATRCACRKPTPAARARPDGARLEHHRRPAGRPRTRRSACSRTTTPRADAPGAADDGFGVAVSLEAARVLAATDRPAVDADGARHRRRRSGADGRRRADDRSRGHRPAAGVHQRRIDRVGRSGDAVRDRPGQRLAGPAVGAARAASARRLVRHRDLQAAAERHRLLDPQAARDSRAQLRRRRRQLRVSHGARHAERLSPAGVRDAGENVVAIVTALDAPRHHRSDPSATRPTSTSAALSAVSYGPFDGLGRRRVGARARRHRVGARHRGGVPAGRRRALAAGPSSGSVARRGAVSWRR